jgi:hypothetical protein
VKLRTKRIQVAQRESTSKNRTKITGKKEYDHQSSLANNIITTTKFPGYEHSKNLFIIKCKLPQGQITMTSACIIWNQKNKTIAKKKVIYNISDFL